MKITVNGDAITFAGQTLADLLADLGHDGAQVATAVNGAFVAAPSRAGARLHPGDTVEILAPRQGG